MDALICLLAGKSSRMGSLKQHLSLGEKSFLENICQTVTQTRAFLAPLLFVGSPGDWAAIRRVEETGGLWIENRQVDLGPLHSIKLALEQIPPDHGFLLWPVDHPLVSLSSVRAILETAMRNPEKIVIPSFNHRRGHPAHFPAWIRPHLLEAPLERGAKWVLQKFPEHIEHVVVEDRWVIDNLNTPEKYREALSFLGIAPISET